MPTVQDEEESLCLLAADLQDLPPRDDERIPNAANTNWTTNDDDDDEDEEEEVWNEQSSFLPSGNAEKAFYNVCKTNEEEIDEDCMEVMNDIIGALEADHVKVKNKEPINETDDEIRNSRSLVVDIHLPPASEDEEVEEKPPVLSVPTSRPFKHEVNRFQRCYSDGSQSSPKRKGKAAKDQHNQRLRHSHFGGDQQHHSGSSGLSEAYHSMQEENLDRIETVICDSEQLAMASSRTMTGTKAKNFRGSVVSDGGGSSVSLLKGAAFGIHHEFMQFKNSLLEGKTNLETKQKRKSDSEMYASDSPSPLVKFELNDSEDVEDMPTGPNPKQDEVLKVDVKKPHKFIYPRLNFFGSGSSNVVADSSAALPPQLSPARSMAVTSSQLKNSDNNPTTKNREIESKSKSPYTFFTVDSDDDFDPYGSDVPSDVETKRDLLLSHSLENQNVDIDRGSCCLSASSSTVSMPVCRICQLPGMEPSNPLISPCRCLGSIRYVHNNCLLKWLEVSSRRRSGPPCCELCQYQYLRHKKFVISHWRFPECSLRDKFLHFFFIVNVCLMIACAAVTIICFKEIENQPIPYETSPNYRPGELTLPELITISCGILFFLAFFLAIWVEVRAKHTIYQLICRFFYMNHEWSVEEYDRKRDIAESRKKKEKESKKRKFRYYRRRQQQPNSNSDQSSSRQNTSATS